MSNLQKLLLFTITAYFILKKKKEEKQYSKFSDNNTKTIKQKLQQQQENLYTRRKCILKEMLKGEVSYYYTSFPKAISF